MRVLFLTHSFPRGLGDPIGSSILRLASALRAEDIDTRVVAPSAAGAPDHDTLDDIHVDRFHYAPRRFETLPYTGAMASRVQASWSARLTMLGFLGAEFRSAVRARREFGPDVVHAHWWFPNGLVGSWVGRIGSTPLVTTLHGSDIRLARAVALSRPAFRHVLHHSAVVTAASPWLASEAQNLVSAPRPVVAPMPAATELFSPDGARRRGDRLLFVGRLNRQTGVELLLHALSRVPSASVQLDVVGDGEHRAALEDLAASLKLSNRVTWHGTVDQARLVDFYRGAAALVVPSVADESGRVAVDAQLCETPVVAFASGSLPDVVQHDRTGILVHDIDASALAGALVSLLERDDRGAALGAAGRVHALATFAPESVARRYAQIYKSAVASSPM